ncbi:hypothetical protein SCALM49S_05329 [Streptomyces californicus]
MNRAYERGARRGPGRRVRTRPRPASSGAARSFRWSWAVRPAGHPPAPPARLVSGRIEETIVLGIGETLVRDDRRWSSWADWLGVPPHTLSALVGAAVAQGHDAADALRTLRPGMDVEAAYRARSVAGRGEHLDESDLYQDVRPALGELRAAGVRVVVAGNGSARAGSCCGRWTCPPIWWSPRPRWGVRKPDPEFLAGVAEAAEAPPGGDPVHQRRRPTTCSRQPRRGCGRRICAGGRTGTGGRTTRTWWRRRSSASTR